MSTTEGLEESVLDQLAQGGPHLSVGILAADPLRLGSELQLLENLGVALVHIDVMDGVFCPSITVGASFVKGLKTSLRKDVHLMIHDPLPKVEPFVDAGADILTVHVESTIHPHRVLQLMARARAAAPSNRRLIRGIALNPGTPLCVLEPLFEELDYVLLLAVNPGWSGQSFIRNTESRLRAAREMIQATGRRILLGVDGGITKDNAGYVASLGVDLIVAGSAIFDGRTPEENTRYMQAQLASRRP